MKLNCRVMYVPRAGSPAEDYEDAYNYSADAAVAAISDGVSSAYRSRHWARLLVQTFVESPPSGPGRLEALDLVNRASAAWHASISWPDLDTRERAAASRGSAATLLGLRLEEPGPEMRSGKWWCMAMGDSCLFHIANGHLVNAVPVSSSVDYSRRPPLLYTQPDLTERDISSLVLAQGTWHGGDTFFLLTDAIARWFLSQVERGLKPWETLAAQDERSFRSFVDQQWDRRLMRPDDVTVVILDALTARRHPVSERDLPVDSVDRTDRIEGHAFISYVREDSRQVDRLQEALEAAGVRVWRDTADLWPGEDWRMKIRRAITDDALVFIACFSQKSVSRHKSYQNEELTLAFEQMRRRPPNDPWLIPVRLDECEIPDREIGAGRMLASIQRADLFGDHADLEMRRLVAVIQRKLARRPGPPAS
jgi:hypothetical protein